MIELEQVLHNQLEENHPLYGLQASPVPPQPADLFLLGTTPSSAALAASLGLPYVFALFLNSDESVMAEAMAPSCFMSLKAALSIAWLLSNRQYSRLS